MRRSTIFVLCAALSVLLLLMACSGGSSSSSSSATTGNVNAVVSDDATQDWATIGVKVLSITLTPQGGGTPVSIYTAPSSGAPSINLVQLDQLGEIIGNVSIPAGTYSQATITLSGNPSDITLTSAPDPEAGFPLQTVTTVPSNQIQVVGAFGSPLTVPVTVALSPVLTVATGSSNALDLEFDLANPAFIVEHVSAAGTFWTINFSPAVRHHPIRDITKLVLRRLYGTVTSVSSDNTSITVNKILPTLPAANPETSSATSLSLQILADATNGTIYRNLDTGGTKQVITNFSSVASSLPNQFVRIQARYEQNGTLVATRIWSSSSFAKVYVSGEGHVLDVTASTFTIVNEDGTTSTVTVDGNTQFFFQNGTTAIGTGTSFLGAPNFVRGFKVLYNSQDDSVIIEIARFSGLIQSPTATNFKYNRTFDTAHSGDDYTVTLPYISSSTANGEDNNGNAISGFKWWYFAQPTGTLDFGSTAISPDFTTAASAIGVNYGGSLGTQSVAGVSYATWNDPASANAWSAQWAVLLPTPAPLSKVTTAAGAITNGASFGMTPLVNLLFTGTPSPVTVDVSSKSGQATLVYQVSLSNGVVTITPLDITQSANLTTLINALVNNTTLVKVYGVPGNGTLNAYVLFYFTGTAPTQ
jgi:hypothetical protein